MKQMFWVLLLVAAMVQGSPARADSTVTGFGTADCIGALKAGGKKIPKEAVIWMQGFLTAMSFTESAPDEFSARLRRTSFETLGAALQAICEREPLKTVQRASFDIYQQLGGSRRMR